DRPPGPPRAPPRNPHPPPPDPGPREPPAPAKPAAPPPAALSEGITRQHKNDCQCCSTESKKSFHVALLYSPNCSCPLFCASPPLSKGSRAVAVRRGSGEQVFSVSKQKKRI